MGLLVDGEWRTDWYDTKKTSGRFVRKESSFRNWVTRDGSSGFPAEAGRSGGAGGADPRLPRAPRSRLNVQLLAVAGIQRDLFTAAVKLAEMRATGPGA